MASAEKQTAGIGKGTPGPGRKKGVPNKSTTEFRDTVKRLLENNSENVGKWLQSVAEGDPDAEVKADPGKALDLLAKLAEFAAPKLSRSEVDANVKGSVSIVDTVRAFHERRASDSDVQG